LIVGASKIQSASLVQPLPPPQQIIQPWQFGHGEVKATCLWLKNLPSLKPTQVVEGREAKVHRMPPGPNRWKDRSRTYQGIADAMGLQWGSSMLPPVVEQLCLSNTSSSTSA
jgi:hypothetical protein